MKRFLFLSAISVLLFNCSRSSTPNENCQFLLNIPVNLIVNLNLPQFSQLQFPSQSVYVQDGGNGGIILIRTGTGIEAFDAADPNRILEECSILQIDGPIASSSCEDENQYNLFTGLAVENPDLNCPLKRYRVEQNGSTLRIFN
jgi:hypothetical protein